MKRYPYLKEALEKGCKVALESYGGTLIVYVSKVSKDGKRVLSKRGYLSYEQLDLGVDVLTSKLDWICEDFLKTGEDC